MTALTLAGCSGDSGIDNATEVNQGGTDIIGNAITESDSAEPTAEPAESEVAESTEPTAEPAESEVAESTEPTETAESEVAESAETAESEVVEPIEAVDILGQTTLKVLEPDTEYVIPSRGYTGWDYENEVVDIYVKTSYSFTETDNGDGTKTMHYEIFSENDGTVQDVFSGAHLHIELFDKYAGKNIKYVFDMDSFPYQLFTATTADGAEIAGKIRLSTETLGTYNICIWEVVVPTDYDGIVCGLHPSAVTLDSETRKNMTISELEESAYIVAWLSN